jgi:hypothetical protein
MKTIARYLQASPTVLLTGLLAGSLLVACANEKDPVPDLPAIRAKEAQQQANGTTYVPTVKGAPSPVTPAAGGTKVVPGPTVYVPQEVIKNYEGNKITSDDLKWTLPSAATFSESVAGKFTATVRCLLPDCTPTLKVKGLPEGATFTKVASKEPSSSAYELAWSPAIGTVDRQDPKGVTIVNLDLEASATAKDPKFNTALQGIVKTTTLNLLVTRAAVEVKDVTVTGLPNQTQENTSSDFVVSARITGIDPQAATKPTITVYGDAGGPVEINGAGFIPLERKPEYAGNSIWNFKLKFDTHGFVAPRKDGDTVRAGIAFQICIYGQCSDVKTAKIEIKYAKPAPVVAPAASAGDVAAPAGDKAPAAKPAGKTAAKTSAKTSTKKTAKTAAKTTPEKTTSTTPADATAVAAKGAK